MCYDGTIINSYFDRDIEVNIDFVLMGLVFGCVFGRVRSLNFTCLSICIIST